MNAAYHSLLKANNLDNENHYGVIESIYTNPETVITIIETGAKIIGLFGRNRSSSEEELKYLKKIYREVLDMQHDISSIINLLQSLRVYIDQSKTELIASTLYSKIVRGNLTLVGYLENQTGNIELELAEIHETKHLLGVYGFAHIHVYLLAFQMELELCYYCKKGGKYRSLLLEDSRGYFTRALNPTDPMETPAKRLAAVNKAMSDLESSYGDSTHTEDVRTKLNRLNACGADGYKITRYRLKITGSLKEGFTFTESSLLIAKQDPTREPCDNRNDHGIGGHKYLADMEKSVFAAPENSTPSLNKIRDKYTKAHELYLSYLKSRLELTALIKTIQDMLAVIPMLEEADTV